MPLIDWQRRCALISINEGQATVQNLRFKDGRYSPPIENPMIYMWLRNVSNLVPTWPPIFDQSGFKTDRDYLIHLNISERISIQLKV